MSDEVVEDLAPSAATRSLATRRCARRQRAFERPMPAVAGAVKGQEDPCPTIGA
jgi:hypothetical protein